MPNLKIRKFNGIYTNGDIRDVKPEFLLDSTNIKYEYGIAKSISLDNKEITLPDFGNDITIETVKFCYLKDDKIRKTKPDSKLRKVIILITNQFIKGAFEEITTEIESIDSNLRKIFLGNVKNEYIEWEEPYYDGIINNSKKSQIVNEDGIVKVYTENDSYWVGVYYNGNKSNIIIQKLFEYPNIGFNPSIDNWDSSTASVGQNLGKIELKKKIEITQGMSLTDSMLYHFIDIDTDEEIVAFHPAFFLDISGQKCSSVYSGIPYSGAPVSLAISRHFFIDNGIIPEEPMDKRFSAGKLYWVFPIEAIDTYDFRYGGIGLIDASLGFDVARGNLELLYTVVLDDKTELVHSKDEITQDEIDPLDTNNYIIKFNLDGFLVSNNKYHDFSRVTHYKIYAKYKPEVDFQLLHTVNLFPRDGGFQFINNYYLADADFKGIYLTQNIGITYDEYFNKLDTIEEYVNVDGIGYALKNNSVYPANVGNGYIQNELFYETNRIPLNTEGEIVKIDRVGNSLGIYTNKELILMITENYEGNLIFIEKDRLELGIPDYKKSAQTAQGVIILSSNGIFFTNGYENQWLSEQINDIVLDNYENGEVYYNSLNQELFYIYNNEDLWRYRFLTGQWEKFISMELNKPLITEGFNKDPILANAYGIYNLIENSTANSELRIREIDLGDMQYDKTICDIIIDIESSNNSNDKFKLWIGNWESDYYSIERRQTFRISVPINKRKWGRDISFDIISVGKEIKLHNIEIEYNLVGLANGQEKETV